MALATNTGIFFMLGVTVSVLAAFAGFFIYDAPREARRDSESSSGDTGQYVLRAAGPVFTRPNPGSCVRSRAERDD